MRLSPFLFITRIIFSVSFSLFPHSQLRLLKEFKLVRNNSSRVHVNFETSSGGTFVRKIKINGEWHVEKSLSHSALSFFFISQLKNHRTNGISVLRKAQTKKENQKERRKKRKRITKERKDDEEIGPLFVVRKSVGGARSATSFQ